jgi:hypothetical protein
MQLGESMLSIETAGQSEPVRGIVDVLPVENDRWRIRLSDGNICSRAFQDKGEAIARAKEILKCAGNGCLVVRGTSGDIQLRYYFESLGDLCPNPK